MTNAILEALQSHAVRSPDIVALRGDTGETTYGELWQRVREVSAWLRGQGIRTAGLAGENSMEWIVADLAAWHAGIALVPIPSFFSSAQISHVLRSAALRCVIACGDAPSIAPAFERHAGPIPGIRLDLLEGVATRSPAATGVCKITFTSGTTGSPKGVCLDTPMLEAVARALASRIHAAPGMAQTPGVHFTLLPLGTLLENVAGVYVPLWLGRSVAVRAGREIGLEGSSGIDVPSLGRALHAARPDSLIVLPQILRALVAAAEKGFPPPASLRFIAVGGAATPVALLERARALGMPVYEGYGLSECASVVALNAPGADRPGSVGRVLDHVRVRVRDGAIEVAGNVFAGYLGQPPPDRGAWLDTGDLGRLDDEGFLYVTGRRKNVIISSFGRNVSPEWVESELSLCPSIAQVMVIGEAQPFLSAIVVPVRGASPAEIAHDIAAVNGGLPDYARLRRFIVDAHPFTAGNASLTENGRLRREAIAARHAPAIDALYAAAPRIIPSSAIHDVF